MQLVQNGETMHTQEDLDVPRCLACEKTMLSKVSRKLAAQAANRVGQTSAAVRIAKRRAAEADIQLPAK